MQKTLADLAPSEYGYIQTITGADGLSHRLAELGFTSGQVVGVIRLAPLGDPMQIKIRGFSLALRRQEASRVVLTSPVSSTSHE
jgi:Fe2+ transport system protein FeoA